MNKETAFTPEERREYGLEGLLPHTVDTLDWPLERVLQQLDAHVPLYVWPTGSGTQSNMHVNEVLANRAIQLLGRSLMLVTALSPVIGYDKASAIAHKANDEGLTLKEAALTSGYIDEQRFDAIVDPRKMVGHGVAGS